MTASSDNSDPRDYILDLSTVRSAEVTKPSTTEKQPAKIPFLSIHFKCCNVYAPIYRNATATAYAGHCPRCHRALSVGISPDGSTARTFQAG